MEKLHAKWHHKEQLNINELHYHAINQDKKT